MFYFDCMGVIYLGSSKRLVYICRVEAINKPKKLSIMTIICNNFSKNQPAAFKVIGKYKGQENYMAEYNGALYSIFDLNKGGEITISKKGCIGLFKTSDYKIVK